MIGVQKLAPGSIFFGRAVANRPAAEASSDGECREETNNLGRRSGDCRRNFLRFPVAFSKTAMPRWKQFRYICETKQASWCWKLGTPVPACFSRCGHSGLRHSAID